MSLFKDLTTTIRLGSMSVNKVLMCSSVQSFHESLSCRTRWQLEHLGLSVPVEIFYLYLAFTYFIMEKDVSWLSVFPNILRRLDWVLVLKLNLNFINHITFVMFNGHAQQVAIALDNNVALGPWIRLWTCLCWALVAHSHNPSYLKGWDPENSRPAQVNK
jgi:hypothetical protein